MSVRKKWAAAISASPRREPEPAESVRNQPARPCSRRGLAGNLIDSERIWSNNDMVRRCACRPLRGLAELTGERWPGGGFGKKRGPTVVFPAGAASLFRANWGASQLVNYCTTF